MAPSKMKAIVIGAQGTINLQDVDVPTPAADEILIKVVAAAQNPTDWKTLGYGPTPGTISGCDYAGTVEALGSAVTDGKLKVGDHVAGFVHGTGPRCGSFAEYVVAPPDITIRIPPSWSFEQAAQLGVAGLTACMCLYYKLHLPTPLSPATTPEDILVWGGSSSVGLFAVQLAKLANLRVIATASEPNFDLVKSFGADLVLSYSDPETPAKIKQATNGKLKYVVDCISEGGTGEKIAQAVSDDGADVSIVLPYEPKRENIKIHFILAYMLLGKGIEKPMIIPADKTQFKFGGEAADMLSQVLASGQLLPAPIKLMPNGLASVSEGFDYMRSGKVHGEKIIYRIADTK